MYDVRKAQQTTLEDLLSATSKDQERLSQAYTRIQEPEQQLRKAQDPTRNEAQAEKIEIRAESETPTLDKESSETDEKYCYCQEEEHGPMIACDNPECERKWFHLDCTELEELPNEEESWLCKTCRGWEAEWDPSDRRFRCPYCRTEVFHEEYYEGENSSDDDDDDEGDDNDGMEDMTRTSTYSDDSEDEEMSDSNSEADSDDEVDDEGNHKKEAPDHCWKCGLQLGDEFVPRGAPWKDAHAVSKETDEDIQNRELANVARRERALARSECKPMKRAETCDEDDSDGDLEMGGEAMDKDHINDSDSNESSGLKGTAIEHDGLEEDDDDDKYEYDFY